MEKQKLTISSEIVRYNEAIAAKKEEEKQLVKLLKDYRSKFADFDKALKNSRQAYKKY